MSERGVKHRFKVEGCLGKGSGWRVIPHRRMLAGRAQDRKGKHPWLVVYGVLSRETHCMCIELGSKFDVCRRFGHL